MKQIFTIKEPKGAIRKAADIFKKIKKLEMDYSQENFILICLNTKNQIISSEVIFKGGLNMTVADPKTLFRRALLNNANSIIIGHNHPSESLEPSKDDLRINEIFKKVGELIDLKVLDNIIFSEKEFYSLEGA